MIKLFFLMIFFLAGPYSPKADEGLGGDQEFIAKLDNIKNPFEDGIPKPIIINEPTPIYHGEPIIHEEPKTIVLPEPVAVPAEPPVVLPDLKLQGVMVGEDMHQAIINDQVVPLLGTIDGARVDSVSKEGVELFFKGKKFFLKVD